MGTFYYIKIPFGLRNAGAMYHRLADKVFKPKIGRNIKIYVDDVVIKSKDDNHFLQDITETFNNLRVANMKLNPKNASLGRKKGGS